MRKKKPASRSLERPLHMMCLNYLRLTLPHALIHHSPNEMNLKADPVSKSIAQKRNKEMGMLTGFPDLMVLHRGHFLGLEIKTEKGKVTEAQTEVGQAIIEAGGEWLVIRSLMDLEHAVKLFKEEVERAEGAVQAYELELRGQVQ